jgi:hypothetical protein
LDSQAAAQQAYSSANAITLASYAKVAGRPSPWFNSFLLISAPISATNSDGAPRAAVVSFKGSYKASTSVKQSCEPSTSVKIICTFNPVRNYLPPGKEPKIGLKTFSCQKTGYFAKKDEIYTSPNSHLLTQVFLR